MYELFASPWLWLPLLAVAVATAHGLLWRRQRRLQRRREQGYALINELKAYSAWVESLRGEPFMSTDPEELTSAQALRAARAITQRSFPELSQAILRLLHADSQLMRRLWERKLQRLSEPAGWQPHQRDPEYRQLREAQEDLIDEIIARCQVLIGDRGLPWRGTDLDSEFFSAMGASTTPCR